MAVSGPTYSFVYVNCTLRGPGGSIILSDGGTAKEGITIAMTQDVSAMVIGADGSGMHSIHADQSGRITVRLLKNSPINAALMAMFNYQRLPAYGGQNIISLSNAYWGDEITCTGVAFVKQPDYVASEDGGMNEWAFNAIYIDQRLGDGSLVFG